MNLHAPPLPHPAAAPPRADGADGDLAVRWDALQQAGEAVAGLAGLAAEDDADLHAFPERIGQAGGWRLELAARGIADLSAIMQPGLKALLSVHARGQDPTAAALALWLEFHAARAALLALVPANQVATTPAP